MEHETIVFPPARIEPYCLLQASSQANLHSLKPEPNASLKKHMRSDSGFAAGIAIIIPINVIIETFLMRLGLVVSEVQVQIASWTLCWAQQAQKSHM